MTLRRADRVNLRKHLELLRDFQWSMHGWALVHKRIWRGKRPFVVGLFDTRRDAAANRDADEVLVKVEIAIKKVEGK